jgi:hypothetical protein
MKQYNNFMMYLRAKSFCHQLQLLVKVTVEEVYLFYVFLPPSQPVEMFAGFMLELNN